MGATSFSYDVCRRTWKRGGRVEQSACYYGRYKEPGSGGWRWHKLYTDKRASQKAWAELRRQHEFRASGLYREDVERLKKPITELVEEYHRGLEAAGKDADHIRVSQWMLAKLIELGGWKRWEDVTVDSLEQILAAMKINGATASYRNKFIARAKAFVSALLPDDFAHPLRKLHRIREKGQKRTRARRPASMGELTALLTLEPLPPQRLVAYALAAYNGLRRNEAERLTWSDVELETVGGAGGVAFVAIRHKQRPTDEPDFVPLHPYVATLLRAWRHRQGIAAVGPDGIKSTKAVLPSVPDLKTMVKDLKRAKVAFKDAKGRRLDYHALRHTFATNLSRHGCSRATKKKLMRHANQDVTDGYTHADLVEMLQALSNVPAPAVRAVREKSVVNLCTARGKDPSSRAKTVVSPYPAWVLGRVFGTLAPSGDSIKTRRGGSCQVAAERAIIDGNKEPIPEERQASVRAELCLNGRSPWSAYVQRHLCELAPPLRYIHFRGLILPRVPRPTKDSLRRESRAQVLGLLSQGGAR